MKKLFAIIFFALRQCFLTACGNSADESKTETTTTELLYLSPNLTQRSYIAASQQYERPGRMRDDYDSGAYHDFPCTAAGKRKNHG